MLLEDSKKIERGRQKIKERAGKKVSPVPKKTLKQKGQAKKNKGSKRAARKKRPEMSAYLQ